MNRRAVEILLLLGLIPFFFYFLKDGLVGADTFANYLEVCFYGSWAGPSVWVGVLHLLPCNVAVIKVFQLVFYLIAIFSVAWFGEVVFGEDGWKVGVFAFGLCPLFFQVALSFEAQWFGFTVAFLGFVGFIAQKDNKSIWLKALFLIILCLGVALWQGSLLLLIALSLYVPLLLVLSIPLILFKLDFLVNYALSNTFFSNTWIAEETPLIGAAPTLLLWPFIDKTPKKFLLPTLFLFLVGLIKIKYMFLAIPFLALGFYVIDKANRNMKIFGSFEWPNLILIALVLQIAVGILTLTLEPTQNQTSLYIQAIQQSQNTNIPLYNDWGIGWYLETLGFETNYKMTYPNPDYNHLQTPFLAITVYDTNQNCQTINQAERFKLIYCV